MTIMYRMKPAYRKKPEEIMNKIPTIFKRNPENMSELLNEQNPECLWVFEGKGVVTPVKESESLEEEDYDNE